MPGDQEALRGVRKASNKVQTMSTLGTMNYQPNMVSDSEGWAALAARIRRTGGCLFWEPFSGVAVLTQAFVNEGWDVGPPIDVANSREIGRLNAHCPGWSYTLNEIFMGDADECLRLHG